MIRGCHHHRIEIVAFEEFPKIRVSGAVGVSVFFVDRFFAGLSTESATFAPFAFAVVVIVDIADRDSLEIAVIEKGIHHTDPAVAHSNEGHRDPFGWSGGPVLPQSGRGNDRGKANAGSSSGDKFSAGKIHKEMSEFFVARARSIATCSSPSGANPSDILS